MHTFMITQMSEESIPRFKIVISSDRIKVDIKCFSLSIFSKIKTGNSYNKKYLNKIKIYKFSTYQILDV